MIRDLKGREILESRGNPTIEVTLTTDNGDFISSVPSGASTGTHEAKELRDNEKRYDGRGVLLAVKNIEKKIKPLIVGKKIDPVLIDNVMIDADNTTDKSFFGANAMLGVSMSVFRAAAEEEKLSLYNYFSKHFNEERKVPRPCFNIINGGAHGGGGVSFQEFMIVPEQESFEENLRFCVEFSNRLQKEIVKIYGADSVNIGDEGGFVPRANSEKEIFELLKSIDSNAPIIIDVAATEFFKNEKYYLSKTEIKRKEEMIDYYKEIVKDFLILGIEDPLHEDDFLGWKELKESLSNIFVIGDDLLVTNTKRMEEAKKNNSCNAMILKINQIGTVSQAIDALKMAKKFQWKVIVSHRSGETNDDFIADFAVGLGADFIKSGAPKRGERVAKYNRLLKIEKEIFEN